MCISLKQDQAQGPEKCLCPSRRNLLLCVVEIIKVRVLISPKARANFMTFVFVGLCAVVC